MPPAAAPTNNFTPPTSGFPGIPNPGTAPAGAPTGVPTMPSPTIPSPPLAPTFPGGGSPLGQPTTYTCSNCNRDVSAAATKCPHCDTHFEYTENPDGTKSYHSSGSRVSGRGIGALIKIGICVVLALIGGGAALIRKLTAS